LASLSGVRWFAPVHVWREGGTAAPGADALVTDRRRTAQYALGLAVGAVGITAVTLVIWALNGRVPASALGGLYVLAILPVAMRCGLGPALVTAASSAVVFDLLFFPPYFSLALQDPQDAVIVLISAVRTREEIV
jgi:two-component system sensor histidine kinase KdpD